MVYARLINHIKALNSSLNQNTHSIDSHFDDYSKEKKITDDNELIFIKTIFYGINRYKPLFQCFIQGINEIHYVKKELHSLYSIFAFIVFFKLDKISQNDFKMLIESQNHIHMNMLLKCVFQKDFLVKHCREKWQIHYDLHFIDSQIIDTIPGKLEKNQHHEKAGQLQQSVQEDENEESIPSNKIKVTQFQEFNLTKVKPKQIPEPLTIECKIQAIPNPSKILGNQLEDLNQQKKDRLEIKKQENIKKYQDAPELNLQTMKRGQDFEQLRQKIEYEQSKDIDFNRVFTQQMPDFDKSKGNVRMNINQILREEQILEKERKQNEMHLKNLEINMRDSSEFNNWKKHVQQLEQIKNIEQTHKIKIQMELQREIAMLAVENKKKENHQVADDLKKELNEKRVFLEQRQSEDVNSKKKLIDQVHQTENNAREEFQKIVQKNRKIRDQVQAEKDLRYQLKKDEDQRQLIKRQQLIQEIRELSQNSRVKPSSFDPTSNMGYGLLEEMSLFELQQRLKEVKLEQEQQRNIKHQSLQDSKFNQLKDLHKKINNIQEVREQKQLEKQQQKELKKQEENEKLERQMKIKEKNLMEMYENIKDKKNKKQIEDLILQKQLKELKLKQQYSQSDKGAIEVKMNLTLQDGQERQLKDLQENKIFHQYMNDKSKLFDMETNFNYRNMLNRSKQEYIKMQDDSAQQAILLNNQNRLYEEVQNKRIFNKTKEFEVNLVNQKRENNRYIQKINEMTLESSRRNKSIV